MTGRQTRRIWTLVRRAASYELGMWRSLYRWIFRRPLVSDSGTTAFGYAAVVTPLMIVFIAVSAIEVPILHMLLPWEGPRLIADALGFYGLVWMFGMLASLRVHPHLVSESGLRIRNGITADITIPWDAVATIGNRGRDLPGRTVQLHRIDGNAVLHVGVMKQTNVDVVLRRPTPLPVPKSGGEPITELRFYADDPQALVAHAREHLMVDSPHRIPPA